MSTTKTCRTCGETKALELFSAERKNLDGRSGRCKACRNVREAEKVAANIDRVRRIKRESAKRRYHEGGPAKARNQKPGRWARYASKPGNIVKIKARGAIGHQIRIGRVQRQPCERCGAEKAQAHHEDYSKPLDVRWLCVTCHAEEHRNAG